MYCRNCGKDMHGDQITCEHCGYVEPAPYDIVPSVPPIKIKNINNIFHSYGLFFKRYFDFKGTSSRSEFWGAIFTNIAVCFGVFVVLTVAFSIFLLDSLADFRNQDEGPVMFLLISFVAFYLYMLATIIPNLAIFVRRVRDTGIGVGRFFVIYIALMIIVSHTEVYEFAIIPMIFTIVVLCIGTNKITKKCPESNNFPEVK